jgi:hypothetical protein
MHTETQGMDTIPRHNVRTRMTAITADIQFRRSGLTTLCSDPKRKGCEKSILRPPPHRYHDAQIIPVD